MKNQITIREAITEADIAVFWGQLHTYHMRDIFPDPEDEKRKLFWTIANTVRRSSACTTAAGPLLLPVLSSERAGHRLCAAGDLHLGGREMLHFGVLRFPGVPRRRNGPELRRCTSKLGKDARRALCGAELRRR